MTGFIKMHASGVKRLSNGKTHQSVPQHLISFRCSRSCYLHSSASNGMIIPRHWVRFRACKWGLDRWYSTFNVQLSRVEFKLSLGGFHGAATWDDMTRLPCTDFPASWHHSICPIGDVLLSCINSRRSSCYVVTSSTFILLFWH